MSAELGEAEGLSDLQAAYRGLVLAMADMAWPAGWAMSLRRLVEFPPGWPDVVATDRSEALRFFEACAVVFEALAAIPDDDGDGDDVMEVA